MSESSSFTVAGRLWLIPAAVLLLAGLFPPETRPDSMIGCAVLISIGAIVSWIARLDGARALTIPLVTAVAAAHGLYADSRGALLGQWAAVVLALAAGWVVFSVPKDDRSAVRFAPVLVGAGAIASLHAIYQKLWGLPALAEAIRQGAAVPDAELVLIRAEVGRAFASFPTPAALGGYLVLAVAVAAAAAWSARGLLRAGWCAAVVLLLAGLACTESVTAIAGALGALGLATIAGRVPRRAVLVLFAGALLLGAGIFLARGREVLDVGGEDTPWSLRAKNFRIAVEMIEDHPWTGVGPGAFGERYPAYRRPGDNETKYAHNFPLQVTAELGLPLGMAATLAFFVLFCGPLFRRSAEPDPLARGIEIGLAAFALQNLADFTTFLPSVLLTAVVLRAAVARRDALAWGWPARLPAVAALVLTLAAAWLVTGTARAENEEWQARLSMAAGDRPEALRRTDRATVLAPWQADHWIAQAQLYAAGTADDRDKALVSIERAVRLAPHRAAAYDLRGRLRFAAGDYPGAWMDARAAARLYPMSETYKARLEDLGRWFDARRQR